MRVQTLLANQSCPTSLVTFTVPAGTIWIVKQIHFCNTTGSGHFVTFFAGGTSKAVINSKAIAANDTLDQFFSVGLALTAGQVFEFSSDSTGVTCQVMGETITLG